MSSILHAIPSSQRPPTLKDEDCDHEISLIDRTETSTRPRSHSMLDGNRPDLLQPPEDESARRYSDDQPRKRLSLREEIERYRYSKPKYQNRHLGDDLNDGQALQYIDSKSKDVATTEYETASDIGGRLITTESSRSPGVTQADRESAIDVLYENQRGCFLCGAALFSGRALGFADFPPWTNIAHKPSATDITNAQVPDPSWEWAWKGWSVNYEDNVDEDGWEYSFMFSKKNFYSWHGPKWYNSFVRRRAWTRKRVKRDSGYLVEDIHRLNSEYFNIQPAMSRSRSPSKAPSATDSRYSAEQLAKRSMEAEAKLEDIHDISSLMKALKLSRIDREKVEAVENFVKNGRDELDSLKENMHDIMSQFIFQASRRLLLAHLSTTLDEELHRHKENVKDDGGENRTTKRRINNLEAAIKAAEEEVKRLEFWSDIKDMTQQGEVKGAVDESWGWDQKKWTGLDDSGPKVVISVRDVSDAPSDENKSEKSGIGIGKGKERA